MNETVEGRLHSAVELLFQLRTDLEHAVSHGQGLDQVQAYAWLSRINEYLNDEIPF